MRFPFEPERCVHEWEHHMWEALRAYCPRCGSFTLLSEVIHLIDAAKAARRMR